MSIWSLSEKKKSVWGLQQTPAKPTTKAVELFRKPVANEQFRSKPQVAPAPQAFNTMGGFKTSTPATAGKVFNPVQNLAVGTIQSTARAYGAVGQTVLNAATLGKAGPLTPKGTLGKALYGTNEPVTLQSVGEEIPFVPKDSKLAPLLAVGLVATDLIGGGGPALKAITKVDNVADATKLATTLKIPKEFIPKAAELFVNAKTTKQADEALKVITNLQKAPLPIKPVSKVTQEAETMVKTNTKGLVDQYVKKYGHVINTDDARELFPGYAANRALSADVHESASTVAKAVYANALDTRKGVGNNTVLFTAGGTGVGKTSAVKSLGNLDEFPIIYDTNMAAADSAAAKIEQALAKGYNAEINFIFNDIQTSLSNALKRASGMEAKLGSGRTVPLSEHIKTHVNSPKAYLELYRKYADNPKVSFVAIDNTGNVTKKVDNPIEFMSKKLYNEGNDGKLTKQLEQQIDEAFKAGRISDTTRTGFVGAKESAQTRLQTGTGARLPDGGGAPKTSEVRERGFVTSAKEVIPEADKIAGQYVPRSTDTLSIKAANLVKDDIAAAERLALQGSGEESVAVASELLKHYASKADEATDLATKNALYDQAAEVANTVAKRLTESGRTVQAASILGKLTPEGQMRFAAKEIQKWNIANPRNRVPELSGAQAKSIVDKMKEIQLMPEGDAKAVAFQKLQNEIHDLIPSRWWEKAVAVWKAGLLTGIKTTGLNVFSNISHAGTEIVKDIPASVVDSLMSLVTGKRTLALTARGMPSGVTQGVERGWRYLKTGYDTRDIAKKLDYKRVNFKSKIVQTYVDGVFRVLGAQDQVFYYGALNRSLYNQAIAAAKTKGLRGAEKEAFIKTMTSSPTDEIAAYALADAETAVFQNKTALGSIARSIQNIPGGEFVVPFGRTPSAVAMQVVNYSPVGPVLEVAKQIARGKFDQRLLSQAIGRGAVGTVPLYLGSLLFKNDQIALDHPSTERERELWKAEGRKANSIKIGDDWRTVQSFGPMGNLLLLGGHFQRALNDTGSHTEAMLKAFFGTIKSFTEQTFLRGVNDTIAAITDPERNATNVTSSFVSSFIPTIINDVARALDPKDRRTSAESFAQTVINRAQSRLPKLREGLEPQITALGQEVESPGNPLEIMIDPTRPSPDTSTPVTEELRRLSTVDVNVSPSLLGDKNGYKGLSPAQNTELWKLAGGIINDKLTSLFSKEAYQKLDDEEKGKVIDKVVDQAKVNARAAVALQLTEGLTGEELKAKLSELKAGGLLTNEVFKKWKELR